MKLDMKMTEQNSALPVDFGETVKIRGEDGATFTPSVSEDGILSWENDKGLENPPPVNIKGQDGKDGKDGADGQDGHTPQRSVDYWTPDDVAEIKAYIDTEIGSIETTLDGIIAVQENLIGGGSE